MIHRKWMQRRLRAYHDGSLNPVDARRIAAHLKRCAVCSNAVRELLTADALLIRTQIAAPALRADDARVMFEIAVARSGIHSRQRGLLGWRLAGFAMLAVCCAVGIGFGRQPRFVETAAHSGPSAPTQTPLKLWRGASIGPERTIVGSITAPDASPRELRRIAHAASPHRRFRRRQQQPPVVRLAAAVVGLAPRSTEHAPSADEPPQQATLLVLVTEAPPALVVTVTEAPPESPGFARATSTLISGAGEQVFTQSTVSSCGPEQPGSLEIESDELMQAQPAGTEDECDAD